MNHTTLPTLTSDLSDRSTDYGSLNLDIASLRKKNPKFEKMRSSLKNSLFTTEKSHSLSAFPVSQNSNGNYEEKDTPTSDTAELNHESARSLTSGQRDKHIKPSKGSLFHRPVIPSIGSIDKELSEIDDDAQNTSLHMVQSTPVLGLTPINLGVDENLAFGDHTKKFPKVEESKNEHSFTLEVSPGPKSHINTRIPVPSSLEYIDSPAKSPHKDYRPTIFQRDVEREVEEIKKELEVENDPHIHFIRGNFYSYYYEGEMLGEGTTGLVKKCIKQDTNEEFAVKVVHYRDDLEILILIVKEFKNHRKLNHKNIIKVYDLYIDYFKKKIYTVMELANCREMFDFLKDLGHYSEAVASGIFKQILTGINYLHHHGVCHRDLKPNNILVSEDGKVVKITDFNVSKFIDNNKKKFSYLSTENYKMWTYTGTIAFTAPEVFIENEYTEAVDMWSAGAVLYTMLCGYQPFQATYVYELIELIKAGKYDFPADPWDNISKQAKSLVKRCLDINNKTRYSPSDALMHPWIANCGKVPNTSIPRTVHYLNRFYRRNTGIKKTRHHLMQKSGKNSQIRQQPQKWKAGDYGFTQAVDSFNNENTKENHPKVPNNNEGTPSVASHLHMQRGKTGPQILQHFPPGFLKLEKSFSFTALDDTKHYEGEKCHECDEHDEAEMSEGDLDLYQFFENDDEIEHPRPVKKVDKEKNARTKKSLFNRMDQSLKAHNKEDEHHEHHNIAKNEGEIGKGFHLKEDKENLNLHVGEEIRNA